MNDWFIWNGAKCTDYGMHVLTQPTIVVAKERVEELEIPGKSGNLTRRQGENVYDSISLSCVCIIDDMYQGNVDVVARIAGWLKGNGEVTFANRSNGFYKARIANQMDFDKILRNHPHRMFSVEFRCDPFFYLTSGLTPIVSTSTFIELYNPGNIPSLPLIKVVGLGEGTIMMNNGSTMLINDMTGVDYIAIDSEAKVVYKGAAGNPEDPLMLLGSRVTGDWLQIAEGSSKMLLSGGIKRIEITPRWRNV